MKKSLFTALLLMAVVTAWTQGQVSCLDWRVSTKNQVYMPLFAENPSIDGKKFDRASLLENAHSDITEIHNWLELSLGPDSILTAVNGENELLQAVGFVKSDRWNKASISITCNALFELYLDGSRIKSQSTVSDKPVKVNMTLVTGVHELRLKLLSNTSPIRLGASIESSDNSALLSWSSSPKRNVNIHDILEGENISSASLSPSGKYLLIQMQEVVGGTGRSQSSFRLYDMELKRNLFMLRNGALRASWLPATDRLTYNTTNEGGTDVRIYDMKTGIESVVASGLKSPGRMVWSPNEDFFLFTRSQEVEKTGDLKRVFTINDRIPGARSLAYLYLYDLKTKVATPLTAGTTSVSLQAVSPDGTRILFSVSHTDYSDVPFSKSDLYEMELLTMRLDTIWKEKLGGGFCQYSPDGTSLLVSGGPEIFGTLGVKVSAGRIPNVSDGQLYLLDLKTKEVEPLTRDFDPAVGRATWSKDGYIYITATERDYVTLYRMDVKKRTFEKIEVPVDVISSVSYATHKPVAVFTGSSISTPSRLYTLDLKKGRTELLADPAEKQFAEVEFGNTEEWNFVNNLGTTIYGRVYYPLGYDPAQKYPVIVNYYGGTTPTDRSFGGRYPKNVWAAEGYIVYVLQPSGATGFGQDFSALHVNGWGREAIDDIIEGTKKFLASHPAADAANVGCIGASYGGYTTMMLQTRTDIFKTAVSHAGISDITSYWGEGYSGYSYSAGATKYSYPWNRRDIYVENSPLFHADKFNNSILLLHGRSDTNVPVGESLQFYAALKILGKDVEMVLVEGEDHHILDYKKRLKWHDTIMSWFDWKLKQQSAHWDEMYPDKNL